MLPLVPGCGVQRARKQNGDKATGKTDGKLGVKVPSNKVCRAPRLPNLGGAI